MNFHVWYIVLMTFSAEIEMSSKFNPAPIRILLRDDYKSLYTTNRCDIFAYDEIPNNRKSSYRSTII